MSSPQFKGENIAVMNACNIPLYMLKKTNFRSLFGLYASQLLLFFGLALVFLNNLNILSPGSYFGVFNWVTVAVFSIGLIINFVSIPHLYFSSYANFNNEDDFWDKETFWILPLFFFGTLFLYGSQFPQAAALMAVSLAIIAIIHLRAVWFAWKFMLKNSSYALSSKYQYFMSLKYLSVYYLLLTGILILCKPAEQIFYWIAVHRI